MMHRGLASNLERWMATGDGPRGRLVGLEAGPGGWVAYTVTNRGQWPYEGVGDVFPGCRVTAVHTTPAAAYAALAGDRVGREGDRERLLQWRRRALAAEEQLRALAPRLSGRAEAEEEEV